MKTFQKYAMVIVLTALFASCHSRPNVEKILSKVDTRKEIMDTIANNSVMMDEMMETMMNSENCKTIIKGNDAMFVMMMENHEAMLAMIKNNPEMIQDMMKDNPDIAKNMMANMLETSKSDSTMRSGMCDAIMGSQEMVDMMQMKMYHRYE